MHTRVVIRVEELDVNGDCIDVPSEQVVADFPNDEDVTSEGEQSDKFYNTLIHLSRGI